MRKSGGFPAKFPSPGSSAGRSRLLTRAAPPARNWRLEKLITLVTLFVLTPSLHFDTLSDFMTVASGLNLVWLLSALIALGVLVYWERGRRSRLRDRCHRAFAVFLAAVALFPCISASDDLVRFGAISTRENTQIAVSATSADATQARTMRLARLLQVLESFRVSAGAWLAVTLIFCAVFIRLRPLRPECWAAAALIRGPPRRAFL
jgi:hypothetical protein